MCFVCNPNNPTGKLFQKENYQKVDSIAKKKSTIVFVDESFIELVPDSNQSVIKSVKKFPNLFILTFNDKIIWFSRNSCWIWNWKQTNYFSSK